MIQIWQTSRFLIDVTKPKVMGIVNVTPDSFSGVGNSDQTKQAIAHAERLLHEGADILDLGAESTRPAAQPVPLELELARLLPVLQEVVRWQVPVSIDTYKAAVMQQALNLGADIINDVWALRQPDASATVAAHPHCGVCLMHMHGDPQTMQINPMTGHALTQTHAFLQDSAQRLQDAGVARIRIVIDPGIGFGKTVPQNFELLAQQNQLLDLGFPILVGWSRKSSLGAVTGLAPSERLTPSVVAAVLAAQNGAKILRVHDVKETVAGLAVWHAMKNTHS